MTKRDEIKRMWNEAAPGRQELVKTYINNLYRDSDAMTLERDGRVVSSLMLERHTFIYQGQELVTGYIAGAVTRRKDRGNGYMATLLGDALQESAARGDTFIALTPPAEWLYYYYERFGFARVFFVDAERYTALHAFTTESALTEVDTDTADRDRLYAAFHDLEMERRCGIIHSRAYFDTIMTVNRLAGGDFVAVAREDGAICAMAFAIVHDGLVIVTDIMADGENSRTSALAALRRHHPELPFKVLAHPDKAGRRRLTCRGLGRVVSVGRTLATIAAANPAFICYIRVTDPIIKENNGTWHVAGGEVASIPAGSAPRLDYDVDVTVLTSLIFSAPALSPILGMPTVRPVMSLMVL